MPVFPELDGRGRRDPGSHTLDEEVGVVERERPASQPHDESSIRTRARRRLPEDLHTRGLWLSRHGTACVGDLGRLRHRARRAPGDRQRHVGVEGHADDRARRVVDRRVDGGRCAIVRKARRRECETDRQHHASLVDAVLEPLDDEPFRRRPAHRGPGQVRRSRPVDDGWDPRVPRRSPVAMPTRREAEFEPRLDL